MFVLNFMGVVGVLLALSLGTQVVSSFGTDLRTGVGEQAKIGDVVTVHFVAANSDGRELANTHRRGLTFTYRLGDELGARFFGWGVMGMKPGGERMLTVDPAEAYGADGMPPIVPGNAQLKVRIELLQIETNRQKG